jgi:hypothetical protein
MMVETAFAGIQYIKNILNAGLLISFLAEQSFRGIHDFLFPYVPFFHFLLLPA